MPAVSRVLACVVLALACSSTRPAASPDGSNVAPEPPPIARESMPAALQTMRAAIARWNPLAGAGADPANETARVELIQATDLYYRASVYYGLPSREAVQAAYFSAAARQAVRQGDAGIWWENTVTAYERFERTPAVPGEKPGPEEVNMAAEAEYTLADRQLAATFDFETGHLRYQGDVSSIMRTYKADADTAKIWFDALKHIIEKYRSPEWTVAALSRQGSIYDSLRSAILALRPPGFTLFDEKTVALLQRAEMSNDPDLTAKAAEVRTTVSDAWVEKRRRELASVERIIVNCYVMAFAFSRRFDTSSSSVARARSRLPTLTDELGNAKLRELSAEVPGFTYVDDMFKQPATSAAP